MLDPKLLRNELSEVAARLAVRNITLDQEQLSSLDAQRKDLQKQTEDLQATRNTRSKLIGQAKAKGEDIEPLLAETADLGKQLDAAKAELEKVQLSLDTIMLGLPNIVHDDVPPGKDESDNVEIRKVGTPREFNYEPRDHVELGARNASLDFETCLLYTSPSPRDRG